VPFTQWTASQSHSLVVLTVSPPKVLQCACKYPATDEHEGERQDKTLGRKVPTIRVQSEPQVTGGKRDQESDRCQSVSSDPGSSSF
jgi:hypothetical protein